MSGRKYSVYAILRQSDKLIVYVGQTCKHKETRLDSHTYQSRRPGLPATKFQKWLSRNRDERLEIIELISNIDSREESLDKERGIIEELTMGGVRLYNTVHVTVVTHPCVRDTAPPISMESLRKREYYGNLMRIFLRTWLSYPA